MADVAPLGNRAGATEKTADEIAGLASVLGEAWGVVDGKLTLACVCGKDVLAKGVKAPAVLKELAKIVGGGGGGRPDSATAGAKKPEMLDEAFAALPVTSCDL